MESTYRLLSTLFDFTLGTAFLFFVIKILQFRQKRAAKNEIQNLQARISVLRMALKSKVKRRANSFHVFFAKNITAGSQLERDLSHMTENKFELSNDFQNYFDLMKTMQENLLQLHVGEEAALKPFIIPDLQNELVIIKIIKEMKDTSAKFNLRTENYNRAHPHAPIENVDPLNFSAMEQITKLLNQETPENDTMTDAA